MSVEEIRSAIITGVYDGQLDTISSAIQFRRLAITPPLKVGDEVVIQNVRPKYLAGLRARVVAFHSKRVSVEIVPDDRAAAGRFGYGPIKCLPATLRLA